MSLWTLDENIQCKRTLVCHKCVHRVGKKLYDSDFSSSTILQKTNYSSNTATVHSCGNEWTMLDTRNLLWLLNCYMIAAISSSIYLLTSFTSLSKSSLSPLNSLCLYLTSKYAISLLLVYVWIIRNGAEKKIKDFIIFMYCKWCKDPILWYSHLHLRTPTLLTQYWSHL